MNRIFVWAKRTYRLIIFKFKKIFAYSCSRVARYVVAYLFTILSFGIAMPLLVTSRISIENYSAILVGMGGLIATILVLASTLVLIPIQRASEAWSPIISKLYSDDSRIKLAFAFLCIMILLLFTFSLRMNFLNTELQFIPVSFKNKELMLFISLVFLGITLDLVRWFYVYVCKLLDPANALLIMRSYIRKNLKRIHNEIVRHAHFLGSQHNNAAGQPLSEWEIQLGLYKTINLEHISLYVDAVAEIAIKAIDRKERQFSYTAVMSLASVAKDYFDIRKDTIVLAPPSALLLGIDPSNISPALNRINESLRAVSAHSISERNESSINSVTQAYIAICKHVAELRPGSSVLFFSPFFYLKLHISEAEKNNLLDPSFQSTESMLNLAIRFDANLSIDEVFSPIMEWFSERAIQYFIKLRPELANEVSKRMMILLWHVYVGVLRDRDMFLDQMLNSAKDIVPYALISEQAQVGFQVNSLLSGVYSTASEYSLAYFFQSLAGKEREVLSVWTDDKHNQFYIEVSYFILVLQNGTEFFSSSAVAQDIILENLTADLLSLERARYSDAVHVCDCIINTAEKIRSHLRSLAESYEFGGSRLLDECIGTVKYISKVMICHINQIISEEYGSDHDFKLANELKWNLSFLWAVFSKKKVVDYVRAEEACDVLAYVGLKFINISWHSADVIEYCCNQIFSVVKSYINQEKTPDQHRVLKLLIYYWYLRMASEKYGFSQIVNKIDEAFSSFFAQMDADFKQEYNMKFENEKKQIERHIDDAQFGMTFYTDEALGLLVFLLKDSKNKKDTT